MLVWWLKPKNSPPTQPSGWLISLLKKRNNNFTYCVVQRPFSEVLPIQKRRNATILNIRSIVHTTFIWPWVFIIHLFKTSQHLNTWFSQSMMRLSIDCLFFLFFCLFLPLLLLFAVVLLFDMLHELCK